VLIEEIVWQDTLPWVAVGAFGALVGLGEIVSRYRDAPLHALLTTAALLHIALNAGAAVGALALIRMFDVKFGIDPNKPIQILWTQILVAGLGAMAFFRSSLFTVRLGDQDIGIGPSSFLQILLDAADNGVDRSRATARAKNVARTMKGISFERAQVALPTLCLALMQNLPAKQQEELGKQVLELQTASFDKNLKTLVLGLKLMNLIGPEVLLGAVNSVGPRIRTAHTITLPDMVKLPIASTSRLKYTVLDEDKRLLPTDGIEWSSENESVVRVDDNGHLRALGEGRTVVKATLDGITSYVQVVVETPH
jgi:hypothetical protein